MTDMNDLYREGVDLRALGDAAKPYRPKAVAGEEAARTFRMRRLAEITPKRVDWLWPGYLAIGKLTLIGGDPNLGKSQICIDAAARISTGALWPRGPRPQIGDTIMLCSEDGIADTVRPRAEAAAADLERVHIFDSAVLVEGRRRTFCLQEDLQMLGDAIKATPGARLVVIDPITAYLGTMDSHRTTDVRAVLEPVCGFAEEYGVAILGVTHPPKGSQGNALRSFTGSFAFVAAARIAAFVTKEPETDRTLLLPVKCNIGMKPLGLGYFLGSKIVSHGESAPHVLWDDAPVDFTADQALHAAQEEMKTGNAARDAKEFLRELLANGPVAAKDGEEAAEANGISKRTLERARKALGVKANKGGFGDGWVWTLP